jgi:hypothetical protein
MVEDDRDDDDDDASPDEHARARDVAEIILASKDSAESSRCCASSERPLYEKCSQQPFSLLS